MHKANFFLSRLTRQTRDHWISIARHQTIQRLFNLFKTGELVKPRRVAA